MLRASCLCEDRIDGLYIVYLPAPNGMPASSIRTPEPSSGSRESTGAENSRSGREWSPRVPSGQSLGFFAVLPPIELLILLFAPRGDAAAAGEWVHGVGPEAVSPALVRAGRRLTTRYAEVGSALARQVHALTLGEGRGGAKIHRRNAGHGSRAFSGHDNAPPRNLKISSSGRGGDCRMGDRNVAECYLGHPQNPSLRIFHRMSTVSSRELGNDFLKEGHGI